MNSDRISNRITDLLKLTGVTDAHAIEELTDHYLSHIEEEVKLGVNAQQAIRETYQEIANLDTTQFDEANKSKDKKGLLIFFLLFIGIAFYLFQLDHDQNTYELPAKKTEAISSVNPPNGNPISELNNNITSEFGLRTHPMRKTKELHKGVDIRAKVGTPVYSAGDGIVIESKFRKNAGNSIIIQHEGGFITKYYHLSQLGVDEDDNVSQGQEIGKVGNTGLSMMPHLHFEVLKDNIPVNPRAYIKP